LGLGLSLVPLGCSSTPDNTVVAMKGWSLTADQVAAEYAHLLSPAVFDTLSAAKREGFARTLADREILVRLARKRSPEPTGSRARSYRVNAEKALQREYLAEMRSRFRVTPEQETRDLPRLCREARVNQLLVVNAEQAAKAAAALKAGRKFEEVAREYADAQSPPDQPPPPPFRERTIRPDDRQAPSQLLKEALLRDLPLGAVTDPLKLPEGTVFLQVLEYRPIPQASDTAWAAQARRALKSLVWMDRSAQWIDSLRSASGLVFHPEVYPLMVERFGAFWDSIEGLRGQGIAYDFAGTRAPSWRLSEEDRARPVYEMWGRTHTLDDYFESLNGVDLDLWPTSSKLENVSKQLEARVGRLLVEGQAEKEGFVQSERMRSALAPIHEKWMLEEYYAVVTASVPEPGPDSLQAALERNRSWLRFPEALTFSVLAFPENREAAGRSVSAKLRDGGSWEELAKAAAREHGAWYLPQSQPRDTGLGPFLPEWGDYWTAALRLPQDGVSELLRAGNGQWFLVRILERRPARDKTLAEARPVLVQRITGAAKDRIIERIIKEQRQKLRVRVWPELLAAWKRTGAVETK
jgi:parvulin-like peptidyl-prolyl isomerase